MDFAYVVVDPEGGDIATMVWLSIQTLRRQHPDAAVTIWTDPSSANALQKHRWRRFDGCDVRTVNAEGDTPMIRSRWIKCRIINLMERDFIFLDCDTLILSDLTELIELDGEFAAAMDSNKAVQPLVRQSVLREYFEKMSWPIGEVPDVNSGVWLARRTEKVRTMGEVWPRLWTIGTESGTIKDQASFWAALFEANINITILDPIWNALVVQHPRLLGQAKIAHFWRSTSVGGSLLEDLITIAHRTGEIDWMLVDRAVRMGAPWKLDADPWQYVRSGHYLRAAIAKISRSRPANRL